MTKLTKQQIAAVLYAIHFTLIADNNDMNDILKDDLQEAYTNLKARLYKW